MLVSTISLQDLFEKLREKTQTPKDEIKDALHFILQEVEEAQTDRDTEFNFVFKTHDGVLTVTQEKFTLDAFDKFAKELNLTHYEPIEFTGS